MKIKKDVHSLSTSQLAGQILSCARKTKNLTQREVASYLEISQPTYSRFEKGTYSISLCQWKHACDMLNISLDTLTLGYLDFDSTMQAQSKLVDGFRVPQKYSPDRVIKLRKFLPLFTYAKETLGENMFFSAISSLDLEPDFFRLVDNQVNLTFINDLLNVLWKEKDPIDHIPEISHFMKKPLCHGLLGREHSLKATPLERLKGYLEQSDKYQTLFSYRIAEETKSSVILNISPNFCVEDYTDEFAPSTLAFLEKYRESFLESICNFQSKNHVSIKETSSIYWGDRQTVYEICF